MEKKALCKPQCTIMWQSTDNNPLKNVIHENNLKTLPHGSEWIGAMH